MRTLLIVVIVLSGCSEPHRDVAYWTANPEERDNWLAECSSDKAKYQLDGNCINAVQSRYLTKERGGIPSIKNQKQVKN